MTRNTEYWHNKGEKDYAEGKGYHRPHGTLAATTETFAPVYGDSADARAENEAYSKGWHNAEKQEEEEKK